MSKKKKFSYIDIDREKANYEVLFYQ
jgi:hypothetical protein